MPTYDYECEQCGRTFEVQQRISAPPLTTCQQCGGTVRRLLAAAPFILKGSGWYVTDYPSDARKKAVEAEKKATGESPSDGAGSKSASTAATGSSAPSAPAPASPSTGS